MAIDELHRCIVITVANPKGKRRRILDVARSTIAPVPVLGQMARYALRVLRVLKRTITSVWRLTRAQAKRPGEVISLLMAWRNGQVNAAEDADGFLYGHPPEEVHASDWFKNVKPDAPLLSGFCLTEWPAHAPRFSILTPVYNVREDWLRAAVDSVIAQTYPHWELILINDASTLAHVRPTLNELAARDPRVRVLHLTENSGVSKATNLGLKLAEGDYVAFMDHDDYLEPQGLHRFAEAVLSERSDLLYSDEAITSENIEAIISIQLRSSFSYDYYLCHPYFVHFISVRTDIMRLVGGIDETMTVSQDVDLVLRLIERCRKITHVPEVLYRWRMHGSSLSHKQFDRVQKATRGALERHFSRMGVAANIEDRTHHNYRDIHFQPKGTTKIAILVTSDGLRHPLNRIKGMQGDLLKKLGKTIVVDVSERRGVWALPWRRVHGRNSTAPALLANSAVCLNEAVRHIESKFTHYLFLDSEIEPLSAGWLEHMLGLITRDEVGIVGPLIIDPSCRIRHAGLLIGMSRTVEHAHYGANLRNGEHNRNPGRNGELLCTRDVSAVSIRCMMVDARLFHDLGGFDTRFLAHLHDVDLCIRTRTVGKKVLFDANTLMLDHSDFDAPPNTCETDLCLLRTIHRQPLEQCDSYYHPLYSRDNAAFMYSPLARTGEEIRYRTEEVVLPGASGQGDVLRPAPFWTKKAS